VALVTFACQAVDGSASKVKKDLLKSKINSLIAPREVIPLTTCYVPPSPVPDTVASDSTDIPTAYHNLEYR